MKQKLRLILVIFILVSSASLSYGLSLPNGLIKSAEQGDTKSQVKLAEAYQKGKGLQQDYKKAFFWYEKAAEQGYAQGQRPLGLLYEMGYGVAKDYKKAFFWYEKAAKQGVARAQVNLGNLYEAGQGVEQSYEKALFWYEEASARGYARGRNHLGLLYEKGFGVERSIEYAVSLYEKAADEKYPKAMFNLGRVFERGEGAFGQDFATAAGWYKKAVKYGYGAAAHDLTRVERQLSKKKDMDRKNQLLLKEIIEPKIDQAPGKIVEPKPNQTPEKRTVTKSEEAEEDTGIVGSSTAISDLQEEKLFLAPPITQSPPRIDDLKKTLKVGQKNEIVENIKPVKKGPSLQNKVTNNKPSKSEDFKTGVSNLAISIIIIAGNIIIVWIFWVLMLRRRVKKIKAAASSVLISDFEADIKGIKDQVEILRDKIINDK